MTAFVVVVAAGLGSYAFRISMLLLASRGGVPPVFERAARYVVPTAFAALATGALESHVSSAGVIAPVGAVVAAAVAVRRTGRPQSAVLAGMPVLWLLTSLAPHA